MDRADREKEAYDDGKVWEINDAWHRRFPHVFQCPNTLRHEKLCEDILRQNVRGKRVLEIGCGSGENAARIFAMGCEFLYGIDVSESVISKAREHEIPGRMEFAVADAREGIPRRFDVIFGQSAIHHITYREILPTLYSDTLKPGGLMLFVEPLGESLLIRAYWRLARGAHTADETPLRRADLRWFRESFEDFEYIPFNYTSFWMGMVSSKLFRRPDNLLLKVCDRADAFIARRLGFLRPSFRRAILLVRKPSAPA